LIALHDPANERKGFSSEKGKAWNVDSYIVASRCAGEAVKQAAAGILKTKFIDLIGAECPLVLASETPIMIVLRRSARARVLTDILWTLRLHLYPCQVAGTHPPRQHDRVVVGEVVVQAQRATPGRLGRGRVP